MHDGRAPESEYLRVVLVEKQALKVPRRPLIHDPKTPKSLGPVETQNPLLPWSHRRYRRLSLGLVSIVPCNNLASSSGKPKRASGYFIPTGHLPESLNLTLNPETENPVNPNS